MSETKTVLPNISPLSLVNTWFIMKPSKTKRRIHLLFTYITFKIPGTVFIRKTFYSYSTTVLFIKLSCWPHIKCLLILLFKQYIVNILVAKNQDLTKINKKIISY